MKSTKTVLAVAIVIVGFAYAVGAGHPQYDSLKHSHHCGPQPEDLRVYRVELTDRNGTEPIVIIPKVEGPNGFVITHIRVTDPIRFYQDVGEGPEEILFVHSVNRLNPTMQFPLVAGSIITATGVENAYVTIIGYVY